MSYYRFMTLFWWWQTFTENFSQSDLRLSNGFLLKLTPATPKPFCGWLEKKTRLCVFSADWHITGCFPLSLLDLWTLGSSSEGNVLTCELNLSWQTLQETCFLFAVVGRPRVWWRTAFCTGSIWGQGGDTRRGQLIRRRHFIRPRHDQLISLFAHAGHASTLRQHVCQGAVSTRRGSQRDSESCLRRGVGHFRLCHFENHIATDMMLYAEMSWWRTASYNAATETVMPPFGFNLEKIWMMI